MEVDVIDDADKRVKQQANGRCKGPLLKRGQEGVKVHVQVGKARLLAVKNINTVYIWYGRRFRKR